MTTYEPELIPCPFCGAKNTDVGFIGHSDDCYLILKYIGAANKKQLVKAWNTRHAEDAQPLEKDNHDTAQK